MNITNQIKSKAFEIGFTKVGISNPKIDQEEINNLTEWFNRKFDATMNWMKNSIEKRISPEKILPEVKSVICVALNYYTDNQYSNSIENGKISRYAWGDDYHLIMEKMLTQLKREIELIEPNSKNKIYADTGPVMEKYFAEKSGIGWRGKHTNVISKEFGSWIFLGEILTSLKLNNDTPMEDFCGTCNSCIEACPTNAIVEPYLVDSNKCISYLTIEHKNEFQNTGLDFKNWIYGCDICQDVCPWNSFQHQSNVKEFLPREDNISPSLINISKMDKEEFQKKYNKTPIKRAKLEGLKRNAQYIANQQSQKEKIEI